MKCSQKFYRMNLLIKTAVVIILLLVPVSTSHAQVISPRSAQQTKPKIYVPYSDLPVLIEPSNKAILMDRAEFEELLSAAQQLEDYPPKLGQITQAQYSSNIQTAMCPIMLMK